jgi:hypothetical protein
MNPSNFSETLLEKADIITEWESGARYGYETVSDPEDVIEALKIAEEIYNKTYEIENNKVPVNHDDKNIISENPVHHRYR